MQCFTWALTAPRRTIFSRSGTKHSHREAANDVWNVLLVREVNPYQHAEHGLFNTPDWRACSYTRGCVAKY